MANYTSYVLIFCACLLTSSQGRGRDLPAGAPKCQRNPETLSNCLLQASESMKPFLVKGMPELGVPPISPLVIPRITLEQGTQALNFKAAITNVTIVGLNKYKFSSMALDLKTLVFTGKATIDSLDISGDVDIEGKILVAPINGQGKFTGTVRSVDVDVREEGELIQKKGKDFLHTKKTDIKIKLSKPSIQFNGLFGNDTDLGQATNRLINENADVLFEDLNPSLEKVISELADKLIFKSIVDTIPFDRLLPKP